MKLFLLLFTMSIFSLSAGMIHAEASKPEEEEIQYEKIKYKCEGIVFECPHPEKTDFKSKAWLHELELKTSDKESVKLMPSMSRNRGAIGPAGSWNVLEWFDPVHAFTGEKKSENKEEESTRYSVQVLTVKEAYVLRFDKDGKQQVIPCEPTL